MWKKVGLLAMLLCGGALLHPTAAQAQEYRGWNGHSDRGESRYYRDGDRFRDGRREHEWREHDWREERQERAWRQHEWREHERWEHGYAAPYSAGPRAYYGYGY